MTSLAPLASFGPFLLQVVTMAVIPLGFWLTVLGPVFLRRSVQLRETDAARSRRMKLKGVRALGLGIPLLLMGGIAVGADYTGRSSSDSAAAKARVEDKRVPASFFAAAGRDGSDGSYFVQRELNRALPQRVSARAWAVVPNKAELVISRQRNTALGVTLGSGARAYVRIDGSLDACKPSACLSRLASEARKSPDDVADITFKTLAQGETRP